jgi:transketolase N-terminal domain/subunit/transketolase C-terminal domain/subunit
MNRSEIVRTGLIRLLEIKDSDIRIMTLEQARDAVDKGIHAGGAFSAVIPLVALYYGGFIKADVCDPTRPGQDLFVLSKGHAVASMASIYADLGYFDRSILKNSRSAKSILKGHPGPLLPGVHVSTGPLGQGISVAEGFSLAGRRGICFDVYCMVGDGELQEGLPWEAVMFSAHKRLDNLCVVVDNNEGQLDNPRQLILPMRDLDQKLSTFGWRVFDIDGNQYAPIVEALWQFKFGQRDGRPTAIISHTSKGFGALSCFFVNHKVEMPDALTEQELAAQGSLREKRIARFACFWSSLGELPQAQDIRREIATMAEGMNLDLPGIQSERSAARAHTSQARTQKAAPRDKRISYDPALLPVLDAGKEYSASMIVTEAMKVFARDPRVISVDSDLSTTSGLEAGVGWVDTERGLNVGIAEANMMSIGEAFAALGYNVWVSTFCPFFDWKVMRRIAIGYQERLETIARKDGWLSKGHGLDLTFLATAPNFETKTNGATHMGNDDALVFGELAHLKIIDVSCPNMLLGLMKWVMDGDRGLNYVRVLRSPSRVLYPNDFQFEYGKAYTLKEKDADEAVIFSSGRGVYEALEASRLLEEEDVSVGVVDMPSVDRKKFMTYYSSGKLLVLAEQNNGILWSGLRRLLLGGVDEVDTRRLLPINTLSRDGTPMFIHSATYEQLLDQFGLDALQIAARIRTRLRGTRSA